MSGIYLAKIYPSVIDIIIGEILPSWRNFYPAIENAEIIIQMGPFAWEAPKGTMRIIQVCTQR